MTSLSSLIRRLDRLEAKKGGKVNRITSITRIIVAPHYENGVLTPREVRRFTRPVPAESGK
jgi:hypothetical protein